MNTLRTGFAGGGLQSMGDTPPKVLIVLEASGGGTGRHVVELAEGLLTGGSEVHLIYSDLRTDQPFRDGVEGLQARGLQVRRVPMRREPHWSDPGCLVQIRRYIGRHGPFDVVHSHSSKAGALARVAAAGCDVARIYTPHAMRTMDATLHPAIREVYRLIEVGLARTASDAIIAVSEFERQHMIAQGVPAQQLHVVPNGIPQPPPVDRAGVRASLGLGGDETCIGFIGRLVPQKAPERFVAAIARLAARNPRMRGVVVGTGPLQDDVHARAREAGIEERMIWVTDRSGPDVLPAFDILAMPSLYEGMPYVLLEALATGVPVVATDVGGVTEAIEDRVTGFVVPQQSADDLVQRLEMLVTDRTLRASMAESSFRKSLEMSLQRMVTQTLQVYRSAQRTRLRRDHPLPVGLDPRRAG